MNSKKYFLPAVFFSLVFINIFLLCLDIRTSSKFLTLAMLDVGQGEAIYVESPSGVQILFDGGPARKVMGPLRKVMSPFDRSIDAVVITNPDADHIGGLGEVLRDYEVSYVFSSGTGNNSKIFENLRTAIKNEGAREMIARKGMRMDLGAGVAIEILFPDRDVSLWPTNDGSVVARLTYGGTSVLLTGDATSKTEKIILENGGDIDSDVLKIGHHGSRSSTSRAFVNQVNPEYALISSGRGNSYGHPHEEVLEALTGSGAEVLRTDLYGTIILRSDGQTESFRFFK